MLRSDFLESVSSDLVNRWAPVASTHRDKEDSWQMVRGELPGDGEQFRLRVR